MRILHTMLASLIFTLDSTFGVFAAAQQALIGSNYESFTDIANWTPIAEWLGLAGPIDPKRAHDIVNAYSLAFFDRHVNGRPAKLLDGSSTQFTEVVFESRVP